ncbi:MAG: hypothetical protein WD576_00820 [Nitriliruptoraceae bacterium]
MMNVGERVSPHTAPSVGDPYISLGDRAALEACAAERAGLRQINEQFAGETHWMQVLGRLAVASRVQLILVSGRVMTGTIAEVGLDYLVVSEECGDVAVSANGIACAASHATARQSEISQAHPPAIRPCNRELVEVIDRHREADERIVLELTSGRSISGVVASTGRDVLAIDGGAVCTWIPIAQVVTVGYATAAHQAVAR